MCVVSMVGDHYNDLFKPKSIPSYIPDYPHIPEPKVTKAEFEELKRQVLEMKELLTKALEYDKKTKQVECANDDKLARLEKIAEAVGIDCKDLFKELRSTHVKKPVKKIVSKKK